MLHALINTIGIAIVGFIIGSTISFCLACITFHYKFIDNLAGGILFFLFSSPLIVLVWIIHGSIPISNYASYLFVSLVVIFPMYSHVRRGMEEAPLLYVNTIMSHGGSKIDESAYVRIWSAIPNFTSSLQASWSAAFLAAIISDFASGAQPSLGSYIAGAISQSSISNKFEIALICTVVGFVGHLFFGKVTCYTQNRYSSDMSKYYSPVGINHENNKDDNKSKINTLFFQASKYIFWPLMIWYVFAHVAAGSLPAKTPLEVAIFFLKPPNEANNLYILYAALKQTAWHGFIGLLFTLVIVYFLSAVVLFSKTARLITDPILILFQATPIVAWLGILRMIDDPLSQAVVTAITASMFPAYIFIRNRVLTPPTSFITSVKSTGGSNIQIFRYIKMPLMVISIPEVIAVIAPRVIMGVMLAEYFLTYEGLGGMMALNRVGGYREFWWAILLLVCILSIVFSIMEKYAQKVFIKVNP